MHPLRPFQKESLSSLERYSHTIVIAPTGSGKSRIFQEYLLRHRQCRSILISPLNALARQHARSLRELGVYVSLGVGEKSEGPPDGPGVWILSPEKLLGRFQEAARNWNPQLLIVDEAHCIEEWGSGFRPEFAEIPRIARELKIKKTLWCSATLPHSGNQKITQALEGSTNQIGKFSLPTSLELERVRVPPHLRLDHLQSLLQKSQGSSGMIFTTTRRSADRLLQYLNAWGIPALSYHAGMSSEERVNLENLLQEYRHLDSSIWVIATSAFGMGMDYPFLKTCILFEPSLTLLSLAQALGRVGRAGARAKAYVLWHESDFERQTWATEASPHALKNLNQVRSWCETSDCQRAHLEKYFNDYPISGKLDS